jgi:hypothetical protein
VEAVISHWSEKQGPPRHPTDSSRKNRGAVGCVVKHELPSSDSHHSLL